MSTIHPTALVDPAAEIGERVTVGPFSIIGPHVRIGADVTIHSHVVVEGRTTLGDRVKIFPHASVGTVPQDLKYRGEPSRLEIGADTVIRENVTINIGTEGGGMLTRIGSCCLLMVGAHVAHDCLIGDNVILVNNATLAGHVRIANHAILGGLSAVHQWVRIGEYAFVGGMSGVENDVIPFGTVIGNRAELGGLNLVGVKRAGFERDEIHRLRNAYKLLFEGTDTLVRRTEKVAVSFGGSVLVDRLIAFLREGGDRAICTPRGRETDL